MSAKPRSRESAELQTPFRVRWAQQEEEARPLHNAATWQYRTRNEREQRSLSPRSTPTVPRWPTASRVLLLLLLFSSVSCNGRVKHPVWEGSVRGGSEGRGRSKASLYRRFSSDVLPTFRKSAPFRSHTLVCLLRAQRHRARLHPPPLSSSSSNATSSISPARTHIHARPHLSLLPLCDTRNKGTAHARAIAARHRSGSAVTCISWRSGCFAGRGQASSFSRIR